MIRTYVLPVQTINNTEQVAGIHLIHDALLLTTENPGVRQLIMNTTPEEHTALATLALSWHDATPEETALYASQVTIYTPTPDTLRAEELLALSPPVISMPQIWELMRIIGRRLGYRFD